MPLNYGGVKVVVLVNGSFDHLDHSKTLLKIRMWWNLTLYRPILYIVHIPTILSTRIHTFWFDYSYRKTTYVTFYKFDGQHKYIIWKLISSLKCFQNKPIEIGKLGLD